VADRAERYRAEVLFDGMFSTPRLDHPESVAVDGHGDLWCGGEQGQLYRLRSESHLELVASTGGFILGIAFRPTGELLACDMVAKSVVELDPVTLQIRVVADSLNGQALVAPNFPAAHPDGCVYVTSSRRLSDPGPSILRIKPDGTVENWLLEPLDFANGLLVDPDGSSLLVADTFGRRIVRVRRNPDGSPGQVETVATLPYLPDGLALLATTTLVVGCYEPSVVLAVDLVDGTFVELHRDDTAHMLCHPTGVAVRGRDIIVANLGRWHLTRLRPEP